MSRIQPQSQKQICKSFDRLFWLVRPLLLANRQILNIFKPCDLQSLRVFQLAQHCQRIKYLTTSKKSTRHMLMLQR